MNKINKYLFDYKTLSPLEKEVIADMSEWEKVFRFGWIIRHPNTWIFKIKYYFKKLLRRN